MEGKPAGNNAKLLSRQRASKQFTVYGNGCFVLSVINVNVWLVMLFIIHIDHLDNDSKKAA